MDLAPAGTFGLYAGLNIFCLGLIFLFVPETKGRDLEELDYVFNVTTRRFMAFQFNEQLPWWFRKWVKGSKGEKEPELYYLRISPGAEPED